TYLRSEADGSSCSTSELVFQAEDRSLPVVRHRQVLEYTYRGDGLPCGIVRGAHFVGSAPVQSAMSLILSHRSSGTVALCGDTGGLSLRLDSRSVPRRIGGSIRPSAERLRLIKYLMAAVRGGLNALSSSSRGSFLQERREDQFAEPGHAPMRQIDQKAEGAHNTRSSSDKAFAAIPTPHRSIGGKARRGREPA
ncbi:hypothetical protein THAOC_34278, partial [Thalassiosira oceanica]